ncbi:VOC family protein [soil metagenome]
MNAFVLVDGFVYHAYAAFARVTDALWRMWQWLVRAPKGRKEASRCLRLHDEYDRGGEMKKRDWYQPGVPCWVDTLQSDPDSAVGFYTELFGWDADSRTASDPAGKYFVCKLRGRDVAAIGSKPSEDVPPEWNTYVWVDSVDDAAAKAIEAGGNVVLEPIDTLGGGRAAMLADYAGAVFGVLEPGAHRGAGLVNDLGVWAMSVLNTSDVEGSKRFYGAVFGWGTETFDAGGSELTMWRLPGYVGGVSEQPVPHDVVAAMASITGEGFPDDGQAGPQPLLVRAKEDAAPHWSVNFWVPDANAVAAKAAELGGRLVVCPYDALGFRATVVADPQGAALTVGQPITEP